MPTHRKTGDHQRGESRRRLTIAIDGPTGVGKSTVARLLALRLGYIYLDTGALYRAIAWKVRAAGVDQTDATAVARLLPVTTIEMDFLQERTRVLVDGQDITHELRIPEVTAAASVISVIPAVREWLLPVQRRIGGCSAVVAEGRDIGTKVFPEADVKFFLEADAEVRAARRHRELVAAGHSALLEDTRQHLSGRDTRDRTRQIDPLVPASDACLLDTSSLDANQVVEQMMAVIAAKL
ncbi:MAG: (d)CMP kinase [Nitrospiraceae bacterium]